MSGRLPRLFGQSGGNHTEFIRALAMREGFQNNQTTRTLARASGPPNPDRGMMKPLLSIPFCFGLNSIGINLMSSSCV